MMQTAIWQKTTKSIEKYPLLTSDLKVDVAIVGAGITGITAALKLIEEKQKVAIIEARPIGLNTTGFSTGNLYVPVQPYYSNICSKFNFNTVKGVVESRRKAIEFVEATVKNLLINCNFTRRPFYIYAKESKRKSLIEGEVNLLQRIGLDIEFVKNLPINTMFTCAARLENQARFNPLQYLVSVLGVLRKKGCLVFEGSPVTSFREYKDHCKICVSNRTVIAKKVIFATHIPKGINLLQTKVYPYRSYAIAVKLKNGEYPNGNFWDIDTPYHAISTHNVSSKELDTLIVAGCHHKTGQPPMENHEQCYDDLERYVRKHYNISSILCRWSAQHYPSSDGLPYIGLASYFSNHTYVSTGYSSDGLTYGTVAGLLLADHILGRKNELHKIYNSMRFKPFASLKRFISENTNVCLRYTKDYVKALLKPNVSLDTVKIGETRLLKHHGKIVAVHHEPITGKQHIVSAVCPHLKCIVAWNDAEKTWDCPCHGSRFCTNGKVLEGPALNNLKDQKNLEK